MTTGSVRSAAIWGTLALALLLSGCTKAPPTPAEPVRIAAAADLAFAFADVGKAFEAAGHGPVSFSFGSTGLLAKQIQEGAPFDVFAAANVSFADQAAASGACDAATKSMYARGRVVMWSKAGAEPPKDVAALSDPRYAKIALANPEHAPYGQAAKEAMTRAGVWSTVESRLVFGENVQQTLKFAQSGNADVAFVALSLAIATKGGAYTPVDETMHAPIDQALLACKRGKNFDGGKAFSEFVGSKEGRAIMRRYGFLLPGEVLAEMR
ncbi:MAG TPA: molybdate ABC transporter substrate-binding protein [Polyangiaceae bacterium]|nr:molybdate ABC transporter substrate-binding protein [Polyangiaceae bacterium]